ncbi:Uncharacterized [Syntrophomonas zehnderi OL-4]|uniref:Uncharacterized n=1 Tax=Syntrophomonas zehnderi OL-4 TaxID=690567 RepID=A0A0E4GB53_9FIRM|nr:Uncharacterized [Syntrophomonas zehnderi OL-4]
MQKNPRRIMIVLLIIGLMMIGGCKYDYKQLFKKNEPPEPKLLKVEIYFTSTQHIPAYVKGLGIEKDGQVYVGGSSLNYIYNAQGEIIGSFNYARVDYIKIIE